MEDWGLGPHGNRVSIRMGTARAPVCVGHVRVTALVLAAEVVAVKGPGLRSPIVQGISASLCFLGREQELCLSTAYLSPCVSVTMLYPRQIEVCEVQLEVSEKWRCLGPSGVSARALGSRAHQINVKVNLAYTVPQFPWRVQWVVTHPSGGGE